MPSDLHGRMSPFGIPIEKDSEICAIIVFHTFFHNLSAVGEAALAADLIAAGKTDGEAALAADLITVCPGQTDGASLRM